ncbi:hypothetical protein LB506_007155, partial [Fusarium annulatum]
VVGILKDLPRQEKPYADTIFEMSRSGFNVAFTQKGMQACGSTDTPTFAPGDMCRTASEMPRLEKFEVGATENLRDYVYREALIRNSKIALSLMPVPANSIVNLAKSLDSIPTSVQTLLIYYQREMILDQTYNPPSIIPIGSNREAFAEAMRPLAD